MNIKFTALAEQAGLVQGGWANADRVKIWKEDPDNPGSIERFAELIVKECAKIAFQNDIAKFTKDGYRIGLDIKKHFGVEE